MPPKPRSHGKPKPPVPGSDRRNLLYAAIGGIAIVVIAGLALAFTLGGGGDGGDDARTALEAAGCTLSATPSLAGDHSVTTPSGTSPKWDTVPPTSGPHYQGALDCVRELADEGDGARGVEQQAGHDGERASHSAGRVRRSAGRAAEGGAQPGT